MLLNPVPLHEYSMLKLKCLEILDKTHSSDTPFYHRDDLTSLFLLQINGIKK